MLKAICYGSLAGSTMEEKLALAQEAGFEAVEFVVPESGDAPAVDSSPAELAKVKDLAAKYNLKLSSTLAMAFWQYSLTDDDPAVRAKAVEYAKGCIKVTKAIGAGCVLVVPAVVYLPHADGKHVSYDAAYQRALDCLKEIAPVAEAEGIDIGVENVWNGFLLSPMEFARFLDEVGSPRVGAYFDVGNIVPLGDGGDWVRILGQRLRRVHVKDFRRSIGNINGFVPLLSGDVPWDSVVAELRAIGYEGPLTAEMGGYTYHTKAVAYHTSLALDFILGRRS